MKTVDGKRAAAVEILLGNATIRDKILREEFEEIKGIMEKSEGLGMQTFDSALFKLFQAGRIDEEEAIRNADSANNLRLKIKLAGGGTADSDDSVLSLDSTTESASAPEIKSAALDRVVSASSAATASMSVSSEETQLPDFNSL